MVNRPRITEIRYGATIVSNPVSESTKMSHAEHEEHFQTAKRRAVVAPVIVTNMNLSKVAAAGTLLSVLDCQINIREHVAQFEKDIKVGGRVLLTRSQ